MPRYRLFTILLAVLLIASGLTGYQYWSHWYYKKQITELLVQIHLDGATEWFLREDTLIFHLDSDQPVQGELTMLCRVANQAESQQAVVDVGLLQRPSSFDFDFVRTPEIHSHESIVLNEHEAIRFFWNTERVDRQRVILHTIVAYYQDEKRVDVRSDSLKLQLKRSAKEDHAAQ